MQEPQGTNNIKPINTESKIDGTGVLEAGVFIRSILVVDPDPDFSSIVSDYLRLFGYNIFFKNDVEEALDYLKDNKCEVVFLADNFDHHHPIDLLRRFKALGDNSIIVILANRGDDQLAVELIKSGADDYLSRRVKDKDILTSIASLLERIARTGAANIDSRTGAQQSAPLRLGAESFSSTTQPPRKDELASVIEMKVEPEQISSADIVLNNQLELLNISNKCSDILGYHTEELKELSIRKIIPKVFYTELKNEIKNININESNLFNANSQSLEVVLITKEGKGLPVKCQIKNYQSSHDLCYGLYFEDLSEDKSQQADLMFQSMWNNLLRSFANRFINLKLESFSQELTQVISETANFFKLDRVSIYLFDKSNSKARIYLEWLKKDIPSLNKFSKKIEIEPKLIEFSKLLAGEAQRLSPLQSTEDPKEIQCLGLSEHYAQVESVSCLAIPVYNQDKVMGWIGLDYQTDGQVWEEDDLDNLLPLGALVSEVFTRRAKEEQRKVTYQKLSENHVRLSEQAFTDGLTHLANRRYFDKVLDSEIRRASREKSNLALLFCDLDYFKNYNDCYGHIEGDNCLKQIGQIFLQEFQRAGDFVARYGGEEFAVILSGSLANDAKESAEKLTQKIIDSNIPNEGSPLGKITISIGIASITSPKPNDSERLIENADKALYKAKENGRNRIEIADFSPR